MPAQLRQSLRLTPRWLPIAALLLLLLPALWLSLISAHSLRVDVGAWGDHAYLSGINAVEESATETYRWTTGQARLVLPNLSTHYRLLRLRAHGWRPGDAPSPVAQLVVDGRPWGTLRSAREMRIYQVLLPQSSGPQVRVELTMPPFSVPEEPRQIGLAIDWIELRAFDVPAGPTIWHLGSQALLLSLLAALVWALRLPAGWTASLVAALCGAVVWANLREPLWVSQAIGAWLAIAGALLGATWLLRPRLEALVWPWMDARAAGTAWALLVGALAVRLAGSVHPLFNAHDVDVHMRWLTIVGGGQLYLYSTPSELQNRQTFNPPGGYVLLLPLRLLFSDRLTVQIGVALFDALGCLLLLLIARELRMPGRAALLALGLYLALPINTTMLWWGFATNALAQPLWLLLVWLALRLAREPTRTAFVLFNVACSVILLIHVGALVLFLAALGLLVILSLRPLRARRGVILGTGTVLAIAVTVPIYFSAAIAPLLGQPDSGVTIDLIAELREQAEWRGLRVELMGRALQRGYLLPLLGLVPLGLAHIVLARERHPLQRALVGAWIGVFVAFSAAYLALGLVARYIYFVAPLICLAAGSVLARFRQRPAEQALVLGVVLYTALHGLALWASGVLMRIKPSGLPLTH